MQACNCQHMVLRSLVCCAGVFAQEIVLFPGGTADLWKFMVPAWFGFDVTILIALFRSHVLFWFWWRLEKQTMCWLNHFVQIVWRLICFLFGTQWIMRINNISAFGQAVIFNTINCRCPSTKQMKPYYPHSCWPLFFHICLAKVTRLKGINGDLTYIKKSALEKLRKLHRVTRV